MSDYIGSDAASAHRQPPLDAIVVVNLGTPDAPTAPALRRYLGEFLSDPRVIELPRWLRWLLLNLVVLRVRPARSARAYARVWTQAGSPLRVLSEALVSALRAHLQTRGNAPEIHLAMSYGEPALARVLEQLRARGLTRLLVLPLYPQYSGSTTGAVFDALTRVVSGWRWVPQLQFVSDYFREPGYIEALARSVQAHWREHVGGERLLLSFHGTPRRYVLDGDPYFCQCHATARLLRECLGLSEAELTISFQSRVGREVWVQPYTDALLREWAAAGVRRVQVLCPGFAVDCLETLDEIAHEAAEVFHRQGGGTLEYIPALNANAAHVDALLALIDRQCAGWGAPGSADALMRAARAEALCKRESWLAQSSR